MPVIDTDSSAYNESSSDSWNAQLQNTKILLYEYDLAIKALTTGGHQSYELNSGQSSQRVTRHNLRDLIETRSILLSQIADLELMLGIRKSTKQVIPGW